MNESPAEQMSMDAFAAKMDDIHLMSDRFHEAADRVSADSAEIFGEPEPGLTPEQWAARLILVTAFAYGNPVYVEESSRGNLYWRRLDKASFLGPVESYSLDPERSHFPKP